LLIELLTYEEAYKIINSTFSIRNKCFLTLLWDGGVRIGELANMRVKDVIDEGNKKLKGC